MWIVWDCVVIGVATGCVITAFKEWQVYKEQKKYMAAMEAMDAKMCTCGHTAKYHFGQLASGACFQVDYSSSRITKASSCPCKDFHRNNLDYIAELYEKGLKKKK